MSAQGHKHVLKVHGGHIHIGLPDLTELGVAPPDGSGLVPPHLLDGEDLQAGTGLVHHVFPAGDIAELLHQFLCGAVFQDAPLVQDDDLLKRRRRPPL